MKKKLILIALSFLLISSISAQSFKINISSGYAIPMFKQSVEGYYDITLNETQTSKTEVIKTFSLGAGFNSEFGLQYNFNDYIGVGLDLSYLHGQKISFQREDAIASVYAFTEQKLFVRSIRVTPNFILKTSDYVINPFLKFGMMFSSTTVELQEDITLKSDKIIREWEYDLSGTYGVKFAAGIDYPIKDNLALRLTFNYQSLKLKPSSSSMVYAKRNGNSIIDEYETIEKEISYTSHVDQEYNMSPDPDKPQLLHDIYFPCTSMSIQFGISVSL